MLLMGSVDINEIIIKLDNYCIAPSTIDLSAAEVELSTKIGKEFILLKRIRKLNFDFDYILIDCPPSLGNLTVNALTASDGVIIPMACEFLSYQSISLIDDTLTQVKELNGKLKVYGILPTMYDSRTIHCTDVLNEVLKNAKSGGMPVMFGDFAEQSGIVRKPIIIKKSVRFSDSSITAKDILSYTDDKFSGKAAYRVLAKEISRYE